MAVNARGHVTMRINRFHVGVSICLVQLLASALTSAEGLKETKPFVYTDDWALVSAPPPPGPYNSVNIDPRVPGQDAAPPIPVEPPSLMPMPDLPEAADTQPPAAGTQAPESQTDIPEAAPFPGRQPAAGEAAPVTGPYSGEAPADIPEAAPFPEYPPPASGRASAAGPRSRAGPVDRPEASPLSGFRSPPARAPMDARPRGRAMPAGRPESVPVPGYQRPAGNPPFVTVPYGRGMPGRRPGYEYPSPGMYSGPTDFPGYSSFPREGYYGGNRYGPVDEVPPPSVYDTMTGRP